MLKDVVAGLNIIFKYEPTAWLNAEHDEIFVGGDVSCENYSPEDRANLESLGFNWEDGWHLYV